MTNFDDMYAEAFDVLNEDMGNVSVTYRSKSLTRTITNCVWLNHDANIEYGDDGDDRNVEIASVHIPTDATLGIPTPSLSAIIEYDGKRYSITGFGDRSPTAVTLHLKRTTLAAQSKRNRR